MNEETGIGLSEAAATAALSDTAGARAAGIRTGGRGETIVPQRVLLGAELPIFCERCGYSLNALPQVRCDHCDLLQFHCPECGHHQPINTLRPAMQRTLGRLRALSLGLLAFFKLNWFGWHFFFWIVMGYEWAYTYNRGRGGMQSLTPDLEAVMSFMLYGTVVGVLSRLLLLRWRSGALVGIVLAALYCTALVIGFNWRVSYGNRYGNTGWEGGLLTAGRLVMILLTFAVITATAAAAWPVWVGFVRVVMPERAGSALLEWQRSLSDPADRARLSDRA